MLMNLQIDKGPMKKITKEYADKIKEELNCVGIILIITDSQMPCPDILSGQECKDGHEISSYIGGLSAETVIELTTKALI